MELLHGSPHPGDRDVDVTAARTRQAPQSSSSYFFFMGGGLVSYSVSNPADTAGPGHWLLATPLSRCPIQRCRS